VTINLKRTLALSLALLGLLTLGASAAWSGGSAKVEYDFSGRLLANPPSGANSISVAVETGNKRALRAMLGASQDQAFSVGSHTEFLRWSKGIPHVVSIGDLRQGDWVTVRVRAPQGSNLGTVEGTQAGIVADRGPNPGFAKLPLWLFRGTLDAPAAGGKLTIHVNGGNRRALHKMLGQPRDETFSYNDATIFLLWQGKVPTVIQPSDLKVGERITVRIRAPFGSSLGQIENTPARHVGEHEPAAS
jgi:uncharacterized protein (DUF58 family)